MAAHNIYGWGLPSPILSVIASGVPDAPASATTSLSNLYLKISWIAPNNNFATISAYKITIADSLGTYREDTIDCNG